jgi:hypothetical protein
MKSFDNLYRDSIYQHFQYFHFSVLLREEFDKRFQDYEIMKPECFFFALPSMADTEKAPEDN